ncbi:hypothetical protein [Candidatus Leptofilum sp.]|uniref:hypothetical protein n=1 Tax=Candidatus Leptofilum sp. TaxID=3241576 RepID=UPI003B5B7C06
MRYQPNLLNEYGVFQRLNTLLRASGEDEPFANRLEHFLYRSSCILASLRNMYVAEEQTVLLVRNYIKQIEFDSSSRIAVSAEPLFFVYSQIPACLTLLVILQNELIGIFQKIEGIKRAVPSSLNKAFKKGLATYGFSKGVSDQVNKYWLNGGKYIRDLRDVNEHHFALVDHSYFHFENDPGQILILLPDNPERKSIKNFTYREENDAFNTLSKGFLAINDLVESILEEFGYTQEPFTSSIYLAHMGTFEVPQNRTLGLMINTKSRTQTENGIQLILDTIEVRQIIPEKEGEGNIAIRKLITDSEIQKKT